MSAAAAVILAAGAGRRMGGHPKALVQLDGEPFLVHVLRAARAAGCSPLVVVVPSSPAEIPELARAHGARAVVNPNPERGMFSSVQLGVGALAAEAPAPQAVLVFPVDHPRVRPETIRALCAAAEAPAEDVEPGAAGRRWIRPVFEGRAGHPVLIGWAGARALLGRDPTESLREAIRAAGLAAHDVAVDDPGVLVNVNTPGDVPR